MHKRTKTPNEQVDEQIIKLYSRKPAIAPLIRKKPKRNKLPKPKNLTITNFQTKQEKTWKFKLVRPCRTKYCTKTCPIWCPHKLPKILKLQKPRRLQHKEPQ